jgi:hypothetical protein
MHSLDWNDLRYFLAVRRAGTLVGVARDLGVRPPTGGRRVEALEAALGVSLFMRFPNDFGCARQSWRWFRDNRHCPRLIPDHQD